MIRKVAIITKTVSLMIAFPQFIIACMLVHQSQSLAEKCRQ